MKKLALALAAITALGMAAPSDAEAWGSRYGGWGHRGWGGVGAAHIQVATIRPAMVTAIRPMAMGTHRLRKWWSFGVGLSLLPTMVATTRRATAMAMAATTAGMASAGWAPMAAITGREWCTTAGTASIAWAFTAPGAKPRHPLYGDYIGRGATSKEQPRRKPTGLSRGSKVGAKELPGLTGLPATGSAHLDECQYFHRFCDGRSNAPYFQPASWKPSVSCVPHIQAGVLVAWSAA